MNCNFKCCVPTNLYNYLNKLEETFLKSIISIKLGKYYLYAAVAISNEFM